MNVRTKSEKLGALIKKVDEQVSLYVRLSAADENGTVACISCNERFWWQDVDCCHYRNRDNMGTRFYLPNLAPGCRNCNRYNPFNHLMAWRAKMTPDQLNDLSIRCKSMEKFTRYELGQLLIEFTEKVRLIRKTKGL